MLNYPSWISLPLHIRNDMATEFGVAKTSSTHVQDNRVVSDGFRVEDLNNAFTDEKIREFLGTNETDTVSLWDMLVDRFIPAVVIEVIELAPIPEPIPDITQEESNAKPEKIKVDVPKKKGRPAKKK